MTERDGISEAEIAAAADAIGSVRDLFDRRAQAIAALEAAAKVRGDGWQSIETAPKGSIILWADGCVGEAEWKEGRFNDNFQWKDGTSAVNPTHWRPLPEPPR